MGRGLRNSIAPIILAYSLLVCCIGTLLGPSLGGYERLAFRDVSHFYTPLYGYVAARQAEDWFPLWNPLDLTGMPLAGETTTAVFYPIRMLVYALAPTPETGIAWYVVVHLLLAAVAIHIAARSAGAGQFGCAIAILTYPLAGPVFFLIYNPPFLVGAAWMPIAIACGLRLLNGSLDDGVKVRFRIAATGIALALPVLGGDPQSSIHVLLLGTGAWLVRIRGNGREQWLIRAKEFRCLVAALVLGCLISAPQLAASIDWGRQSDRVLNDISSDCYDFSVPPWHWLELIVPEASGRLFPTYERISHAIPGDGRSWVMTLYAGIVPIVLMLNRWKTRRFRKFDLWDFLVPIGLFFAISGPYWLIATVVPGYDSFRYPGKWLPLVSLGLAVVAARQAESLLNDPSKNTQSICLLVSLSTLTIAVVAILAFRFGASDYLHSLHLVDRFWGPLQPDLSLQSVAWSAILSTLVACSLWGLIRTQRPYLHASSFARVIVGLAIIGLIAGDLYISVRNQIATVVMDDEAALLNVGSFSSAQPGRAMRTSSRPPWPSQWLEQHDGRKRLQEVEASQRTTKFGRWHLANGEAVFNSVTSLRPQRIDGFWSALASSKQLAINNSGHSNWPAIEAWLGIDRHIVTTLPAEPNELDHGYVVAGAELIFNPAPSPMFRWDASYRQIESRRLVTVADWETRLFEVAAKNEISTPIVESDEPPVTVASGAAVPESIELVLAEPSKWVFHVTTADAGLLTVKSYQDGNWHGNLRPLQRSEPNSFDAPLAMSDRCAVLQVDYLFMGIKIPPGRWLIEFVYRPWWLFPSLTTASIGTLLSLAMSIGVLHKTKRSRAIS